MSCDDRLSRNLTAARSGPDINSLKSETGVLAWILDYFHALLNSVRKLMAKVDRGP